jgi:hypothetical protein
MQLDVSGAVPDREQNEGLLGDCERPAAWTPIAKTSPNLGSHGKGVARSKPESSLRTSNEVGHFWCGGQGLVK